MTPPVSEVPEVPENNVPEREGRQSMPDDPIRWWANRLHALLGLPPTSGNDVNVLTNDAWDRRSGTSEFKAASIRIDKVSHG